MAREGHSCYEYMETLRVTTLKTFSGELTTSSGLRAMSKVQGGAVIGFVSHLTSPGWGSNGSHEPYQESRVWHQRLSQLVALPGVLYRVTAHHKGRARHQ
jgi:hypothetical protein